MRRDEYLTFIRQKCIEANPRVAWVEYSGEIKCNADGAPTPIRVLRPIRIADILLALAAAEARSHKSLWIEELSHLSRSGVLTLYLMGHEQPLDWDLVQDDLATQTDGGLALLYAVLK
jgi:hypothetical protein